MPCSDMAIDIVGVIMRLVPATIAPEHSLFEMAWQAMCSPMSDEEQPVLMVRLECEYRCEFETEDAYLGPFKSYS